MVPEFTLRKVGNSVGLVLPKEALAYLEAAAYAFGAMKYQPFVDGNRRTDFAVEVLFLEPHGCRFEAAQAYATVRTLALAAGDMNERGFADWRRTNSRRASWRNSHYRTPTGASSEPRHSGCFVGLGGIVHDLSGRLPRLTTAS